MEEQELLLKARRAYQTLRPGFTPDDIETAVNEYGMLRKSELVHGKSYEGWCRNANKAVWDGEAQNFRYQRTKFNSTFEETIEHPEDDSGFDIFVPIKILD